MIPFDAQHRSLDNLLIIRSNLYDKIDTRHILKNLCVIKHIEVIVLSKVWL